jgi:hypothetical protein
VVERIEVGKAVADRAGERGIGFEEGEASGDAEKRRHGGIEFAADAREDGVGGHRVVEEVLVAGGHRKVGLGKEHLEVGEQRAEERPLAPHRRELLAPQGAAPREEGVHGGAEAEPSGQHDAALRPGENPRNRAQVLDRLRGLRDAGREPMLSSAISRIGVVARKYSTKPGVS